MNESAASNFINSLVRNLQVLCHSNVEFRNDIEVVGHLYLKVDRQKKFNYIVDEKVCKNDASSTMFVSNSYHSVNPSPKKKDGQPSEGSNKTNTDSSDSVGVDTHRANSKGENRSVPSSPHHQQSSGDIYRTPVKRGMRSPEVPTRKQPRMSGDLSGGTTGPQSFSFSLQRDRESPHKPDRSMSQDSSSSFKDTGGSSEAVEIDLTNIKEEVIDDKSAIQASCFFNQEQQQMLGQSSVPPFPKEPGADDMGLYPISLHANENPNIDNLSQLASSLASGSSQGAPYSQSPQQMPQFLSEGSDTTMANLQPVEYVTSQRGTQQVLLDGYLYNKGNTRQNCQHWRCIRKTCKGKCATIGDFVRYTTDHTHPCEDAHRLKFMSKLRKRAREEKIHIHQLYNQEIAEHTESDIAQLPSFYSMSSSLYRHRQKTVPSLATTDQS